MLKSYGDHHDHGRHDQVLHDHDDRCHDGHDHYSSGHFFSGFRFSSFPKFVYEARSKFYSSGPFFANFNVFADLLKKTNTHPRKRRLGGFEDRRSEDLLSLKPPNLRFRG